VSRQPQQSTGVTLTLLVCTYNRSHDLREMLETALAQETDDSFSYEVLVVDNNSTDDTRRVVESLMMSGHVNLRYAFEGRQGKSHALNAGLAAARGEIYTIADDDFLLPPDWVRKIVAAFRSHPEVSFVSGKVLPLWQGEVPPWLGREHWSAVALTDYGEQPFYADARNKVCLLACSFRRADVEAVGGYRPELGVSGEMVGGVEDLEILQRLWKAGKQGIYLPDLAFRHKVGASRMTKRYHRQWHTGHGRFYATLRDDEFERSSSRVFDVPGHVFRQAGAAAWGWLKSWFWRQPDLAFLCETRLRFCLGFIQQRRRHQRRREHTARC
jgi:glycosyltransferase involved in cell wall biosynthesis